MKFFWVEADTKDELDAVLVMLNKVTDCDENVTEKRAMTGAERTRKWRNSKKADTEILCDENVTKESNKENIYILNNTPENVNNSEELSLTEDLSLIPEELNINLTGELKEKEIKKEKEKNRDERRHRREQRKFGKNAYGQFQNVFLTDEEFEKFRRQFPGDWERRIEEMSMGIASKGYNYKSHYAALLSWARKDNTPSVPVQKPQPRKSWIDLAREIDEESNGKVTVEGEVIDL